MSTRTISRYRTFNLISILGEPIYSFGQTNKRIAVATDSSCVKAEYKSGTLYLTALKEGRCNVTLTSHNGLHVGCVVTVNGSDKEDIPEETTEPATEPATEPSEEPTE